MQTFSRGKFAIQKDTEPSEILNFRKEKFHCET